MGLFLLVGRDAWAEAEAVGTYAPASLASDGFLTLCEDKDLLAFAEAAFASRDDVLVVSVRSDRLTAPLLPCGDGSSSARLHGPLSIAAVVEVVPLPLENGSFRVPKAYWPWRFFFVPPLDPRWKAWGEDR